VRPGGRIHIGQSELPYGPSLFQERSGAISCYALRRDATECYAWQSGKKIARYARITAISSFATVGTRSALPYPLRVADRPHCQLPSSPKSRSALATALATAGARFPSFYSDVAWRVPRGRYRTVWDLHGGSFAACYRLENGHAIGCAETVSRPDWACPNCAVNWRPWECPGPARVGPAAAARCLPRSSATVGLMRSRAHA
jgi:hypothetical protein